MITPPLLKAGDKIGIAATGRKINVSNLESARNVFSSWGISAVLGANVFSNAHSYLGGSDSERLSDFQEMLDNPEIKAIACARGGYGTTRIVDALDFSSLYEHPKWIIGFSDVTALHLKLFKAGIKSIHGTMPLLFSDPQSSSSIESLKRCLFGDGNILVANSSSNNRIGKVTAPVIGGNLSLIADSVGTSSDPDTDGKILVLEEIDEYKYKIDRMLIHLKRSGKLDNLAGLVVGYMTDIKDPQLPFGETIEEIVVSKLEKANYPVAFNFPTGHENPNLAWVHGSTMTLDVATTGAQLSPIFQI
ncbi:MAG TPA: LD-carboxypeptidase [Chryseolinea sp.]|nr:LD-carboxypeptidase [Chryseolinea sp.]